MSGVVLGSGRGCLADGVAVPAPDRPAQSFHIRPADEVITRQHRTWQIRSATNTVNHQACLSASSGRDQEVRRARAAPR